MPALVATTLSWGGTPTQFLRKIRCSGSLVAHAGWEGILYLLFMIEIARPDTMSFDESLKTSPSLLQQVEAKDPDAWGVFVRLYSPLVFSWCRHSGLQASDVADIQQEVFNAVAQKIEFYQQGRKPSGGFRSWLWGITRIQILQHLRSVKRQPIGEGGSDACLERVSRTETEPARDGEPT